VIGNPFFSTHGREAFVEKSRIISTRVDFKIGS